MYIALLLSIASAILLILLVLLKIPVLADLPERKESEVLPRIRKALLSLWEKTREYLSLQTILKKVLALIRSVSFKAERAVMKLLYKVKK